MESGLVSVIVPVYNSEKCLEECIRSILMQSYGHFELILINDGSKDSSGEICDRFEREDTRVKSFHQQNKGVSAARNLGIDKCNGEFLCFVDSDDTVSKRYIENLVSLIEESHYDWAATATGKYKSFHDDEIVKLDFNNLSPADFLRLNKEYVIYGPCCKLYKTFFLKKYNLRFPLNIHYGEDLQFNFEYMKYIRTAVFRNVNDYLYDQESNTNSLSNKYRSTMFEEELALEKIKKSFYIEKNVFNREYEKFLHEGIFDMGYNAILKSYSRLGNDEIENFTHNILFNEQFQEAVSDVPKGKYSFVIVKLMKNKCVKLLLLYLRLRKRR